MEGHTGWGSGESLSQTKNFMDVWRQNQGTYGSSDAPFVGTMGVLSDTRAVTQLRGGMGNVGSWQLLVGRRVQRLRTDKTCLTGGFLKMKLAFFRPRR